MFSCFNSAIFLNTYLTNSFSNCSKDFPFVSGNNFRSTKKPIKAIAPKMKKVSAFPKFESSQGKINCTKELIREFINAITPMAKPLYFKGYNSDSSTHITGPSEKAKQAINPRIPMRTKVAFIRVAASKITPSFFRYIALPNADFTAFLKSISLVYTFSAKGINFTESENSNCVIFSSES